LRERLADGVVDGSSIEISESTGNGESDQRRECFAMLILFVAGVQRLKVGEDRVESLSSWVQPHISEQGLVPVDICCAVYEVKRHSKVGPEVT
jgi:hypothetical protein